MMREEATEDSGLVTKAARRRSWLWLILAAASVAGLVVTLVLALASANRERDDALRLQQSSSDRIILAATLDASMARAEAALGRFVIGQDHELGALY